MKLCLMWGKLLSSNQREYRNEAKYFFIIVEYSELLYEFLILLCNNTVNN